ncbi:MAG: LptF/LptG family permease [Planctomycetota bacterium]|nr:LptF/LptG family permease [Planctomycetota bacterium]
MMLIDRHIAGRYFVNVITIFVILFSFVVAVDVFLNLRPFVEAAKDMRPNAGGIELFITTSLAIVDLWGPRLLQLFSYLIGIVLVAALGFTAAQFVHHREFIALLAGGMSLQRLARPILLVAVGVTFIGALNQEFLLPHVAHLLPRDQSEAGQRELESFRVPLVRDASGRLWYASGFDAEKEVMSDPQVWERNAQGAVTRRIWGDSAQWDGSGWVFTNGRAESVADASRGPIPTAGAETAAVAERTAPIERLDTDLEPTVILVNQVRGYGESLSWRQIGETLAHGAAVDPETRRRFDRIRYGRLAIMAGNILAVILAMPFFLVRVPCSMTAQSLKCAPLTMLALGGAVIGAAAPLPGLPVLVGVFVPTLIMIPLAVWAITSIRT